MRCKKRSNEKTVIATGARKTAALLLCCTIALFFLFSAFAAHATEVVGKFSAVEGRVEVMRDGKFPAAIASIGTTISANDLIKTKSDSKAEIVFYDGNILRIAQRSRIDISEYATGGKAVISMHDGKAEAIVPKQLAKRIAVSPGANKFEIRTINAVGGVRGTDYFASHEGDVSRFIVKEGVVAVYNLAFPDMPVLVTAGNMTVVKEDRQPTTPEPVPSEIIKEYERETTPASSLPQAMLQKDPMRFIGCNK
ncbi:FecR family protein [Dissulfurispira sp.]|uniref:FecR family protein n=1 Tax=Dissulfurispira sp. TaxID=2817609 RepID=UPI002FDB2E0B